jgi:hypothetical protein
MTPWVLFTVLTLLSASCGKMGKPDDALITTDIKAKMFSEPSLKSATVDISSRGGEVTLTGQVPDDSARLVAYKIASEVKGVTKVNDQMTVLAAQAAAALAATTASDSTASPAGDARADEPAPKAKPPARKTPSPSLRYRLTGQQMQRERELLQPPPMWRLRPLRSRPLRRRLHHSPER